MKIESLSNSKVKNWAKLKEKKYRDETNLFLVEGDHLLNSAMVNGSIVEIISTDETMEIPGIPGMRMVVFSLVLLAIILYRREGIMGSREITLAGIARFFRRFTQTAGRAGQ